MNILVLSWHASYINIHEKKMSQAFRSSGKGLMDDNYTQRMGNRVEN